MLSILENNKQYSASFHIQATEHHQSAYKTNLQYEKAS